MFQRGEIVMLAGSSHPSTYRYIAKVASADGMIVRHVVEYIRAGGGIEAVVEDGQVLSMVGLRFLAAGDVVYRRLDDQDHNPKPYCRVADNEGEATEAREAKARFIASVLQLDAEVIERPLEAAPCVIG